MSNKKTPSCFFPSAAEDAKHACQSEKTHDTYRLAYSDDGFLLRDDLQAVRLQLEWLKPDILQEEQGIESTVVIFGGARFCEPDKANMKLEEANKALALSPSDEQLIAAHRKAKILVKNSRYYDDAHRLSKKITRKSLDNGGNEYVIVTGGGPGVMEAANRGAFDLGGKSIGLNIVLPFEQVPNQYITPELCFQFHYFALRKMHFLKRAVALIAYPGGFGTLDELFETLTLIQTRKIKPLPVVLIGKEYWNRLIDFNFLVEEGAITKEDLALFKIVDHVEEAWDVLKDSWD
ncbi:MAG: TIGR00730 family Rossman fold protein [Bermanella sp.]|nr:TIGR00730 family Rossman fold protein [Bermanella sp.]